jgi:cobalt-zinc-cadmium efflux system membrane fusion protein
MSEANEKEELKLVQRSGRNRQLIIISAVAFVALLIVLAAVFLLRSKTPSQPAKAEATEQASTPEEVRLDPETLQAAGIELEGVTHRPAVALLKVTGSVEINQEQAQQATPLVGGRVDQVLVSTGDNVKAGAALAIISSPQIAQLHGKLHEAETQFALAERNLQRVQRAENRVAVIQAKAKLDEAEATLRRTRRLIELGVGAGKDLIAAETNYTTAKADYDFQSNISLNKEVQEAQAAVETSRVDVGHIRDEMRALGAPVPEGEKDDHKRDTALIVVRAPVSGRVTERLVNNGAGVEAGKPLFTIANLNSVWIIANVPEAEIQNVHSGTAAEIRSAALGTVAVAGNVTYVNPQLNEETRTAQVRIQVGNQGGLLKPGMFVEVGFQAGTGATDEELMVPGTAVQRVGDRSIVFIPKGGEAGHFEIRDVELGGETNGYVKVLEGLKLGEKVVTKGSFALKTQMLKSSMEEDED